MDIMGQLQVQRFNPGIELLGTKLFLKTFKTGKPEGIHCRHGRDSDRGKSGNSKAGGEWRILAPSLLLIHRGRKKYRLTSTFVKSCNVEFYLSGLGEENNETHLSTIRHAKKANPWFSGSHENRGGSGCDPGSSS